MDKSGNYETILKSEVTIC